VVQVSIDKSPSSICSSTSERNYNKSTALSLIYFNPFTNLIQSNERCSSSVSSDGNNHCSSSRSTPMNDQENPKDSK
jgi:hypothetical protein